MKTDLKISQQTNHFNGDAWFELFDIESGEVIHEGETYDECMSAFVMLDQNKYELLPD